MVVALIVWTRIPLELRLRAGLQIWFEVGLNLLELNFKFFKMSNRFFLLDRRKYETSEICINWKLGVYARLWRLSGWETDLWARSMAL